MNWLKASSPEAAAALRELEARRRSANENAFRVADEMIAGVRAGGDAYVAEQIERFDRVKVSPIRIAPRAVTIDPELALALDTAIDRVEAFHLQQLPASYRWGDVVHRVRPLRRIGVYVPGGRAVYVSTLIMCAVPARIAGVQEIVVATTPSAAATDELHYVCNRLGIREIYQCGGAAGIAALALGTESLERVDKIAGPGNSYVTAAKARLVGEVGIDMTAGPTELVVIADDTANVDFVQADLDAQQEHGPDSAVICICVGKPLNVNATLTLVADSIDEAVAITDRIAPEHLSIHARDAERIAEKAQNAGAIYCGPLSPPAAGDYVVGSNHVLPTAGSARFFSPLGVYDFVKRTNVITLTEETLAEIGPYAQRIANFEGLPMHAESVGARASSPRVSGLEARSPIVGGTR
ncbi:MAG TPA: histidinol dehydrogenase [Thermoanaerobaculia bacterium]|jgi:histidinol dehydrogenase|nr:histidinol dehydrogenase [Thermoanaerobaculia bacterium]